jgi:dienelactone hydrolase
MVFVLLLVPVFLFSALLWQDEVVTPGLSLEYVTFPSEGGVTVSGLVVRAVGASGPVPGVLVVHDYGGKKEDMYRLTLELARHGFVAMAIDLRGHGMSTGASRFMAPGAEEEDVRWGLSYLRGLDDVDSGRVAMVGYGLGGTAVLQAAARPDGQVNATVVWAAPVDLMKLWEDRPGAVLDLAGRRALPANVLDPAELRARSPSLTLSAVRPNSTLFIGAGLDEFIPADQAETGSILAPGGRLSHFPALDHDLESRTVDEETLSFIGARTEVQVTPRAELVYPLVERDRTLLAQATTALALPVAWLAWERWCTRAPARVRLYNYPEDKTRSVATMFIAADIGVFAAVVAMAGSLSRPGPEGLLAGIAPSPTSFGALAAAALALALGGFGLADVERRVRGRDDEKFEEAETLRRSLRVSVTVMAVPVFGGLLMSLLAQGAPWPRSAGFALAFVVFFVFMLGFEAFLRIRVQRRLRGAVESLFGDRGLRNSVGHVAVGTALYFAMMVPVEYFMLGAWPSGALPSAAGMTMAVGLLSSVFFDRTRNVLAGALFSALWLTWIANDALRF